MNKKVLTLCAGMLLSGLTAGTALAHQPEYRTPSVLAAPTNLTVSQIDTTKWYQLKTTTVINGQEVEGYLTQTRDINTGKVYLQVVPWYRVALLPSLWKIEYDTNDGVSGGNWTFINKETNLALSYDHTFSATAETNIPTADNAVLEDCNTTWEWFNTDDNGTDPFESLAPYAYIDADATKSTVMCMIQRADGLIYSYVGPKSEIVRGNTVNPALNPLTIQPVLAESIVLNPNDFNSMIDFNKPGHAQNAEFKFFYPNGDAMDSTRMTGFSFDEAMMPGQKYVASRSDISDIYEMALAQQGYTGAGIKDLLAAYHAAQATHDEAVSNLESATAQYNQAYVSWDAQEKVVEFYAKKSKSATETLLTKRGIIADKIIDVIDLLDNSTNATMIKNLVQSGDLAAAEDVDAKKEAYDKAIAEYRSVVGEENIVEMTAAVNALKAASAYVSCYELTDKAIGHNETIVWWQTLVLNFNSYLENLDNLEDLLDRAVNYDNLLSEAKEILAEKEAALETAQNILNLKTESEKLAKQELDKAIAALNTGTDAFARVNYILNEGYMRLKLVEDAGENVNAANKYLMVDTTFWQTTQVPSRSDLKIVNKTPDVNDKPAIEARYFFKLTYHPSQDSLVVEPLNASAISDSEYELRKKWIESNVSDGFVYENNLAYGSQPSNTHTRIPANQDMPVAIKLADDIATVGQGLTAGSVNRADHSFLKTRIGFNNPYDYLVRTTLPEGLYSIQNVNGSYVVANFDGYLQYDVPEDGTQNYNNMPATMFVVEKAGCENGSRVVIHNREYGSYSTIPAFEGQLYKHEDGSIYFINTRDYVEGFGRNYTNAVDRRILAYGDDYVIKPITDEAALTDKNHGYGYIDAESLKYTEYALNYNSALNNNVYLNVDEEGYITYNGEGIQTRFELDTVYAANEGEISNVKNYGYGAGVADLPQLQRQAYVLKVRDVNLIDNDTTYVALVTEPGKNAYYKAIGINDIRNGKGMMAQFYLKSDQVDAEGNEYYALIDVRSNRFFPVYLNGARQLNCTDSNGKTSYVDLDNEPQERASAFRLVTENRPLYREVTDETIDLFNNTGEKLIEDGMYLGFAENNSKNGAMAVERLATDNARMPQYLLGFDKDSVADGYWCNTNKHGYFASVEEAEAAAEDETHIVKYNGYTSGRFLVNFTDSVLPGSHAYHKPDMYTHRGVAVRLGFVEGVHMLVNKEEAEYINDFLGTEVKAGEYFFTLVGGHKLADLQNEEGYIIPERLFNDEYTKMNTYTTGKHNNWSFSFRLIDETNPEEFLIESNLEGVSSIGSMEGAWIKDYNGCPVVSYIDGNHTTIEASNLKKDNVTDGEIFLLEATDQEATANETINAEGAVSVVATDGAVIIKGAEGKNVVIATILGKVVANETINSDNETIAVPAGIAVVSVDGESFKVVVK